MENIKKPDYFRFLIIKTNAQGSCEVLFTTDEEEEATHADIEAIKSYSEEIASGECRIDTYKIW